MLAIAEKMAVRSPIPYAGIRRAVVLLQYRANVLPIFVHLKPAIPCLTSLSRGTSVYRRTPSISRYGFVKILLDPLIDPETVTDAL